MRLAAVANDMDGHRHREVSESLADDANLGEVPDLSDDKIEGAIAKIQTAIKNID